MPEDIKRPKRNWGRFLLKYAIMLLIIGLAGCIVLYLYASQYEETRPELVMDELMKNTDAEEWFSVLNKNLPTEKFVFEEPEDLFQEYYAATLANSDFSYRKDMSKNSSDETMFVVYTGPVKICDVYLSAVPGTKTVFGRSKWELDRIESADFRDYLETFSVQIDAPSGTDVRVNGIKLSAEYIEDYMAECPKLTKLESRFPVQPSFVRYRIDKLCGSVSVSDGEKEIPTESGIVNGLASYIIEANGKYSFKAEAPEGIKVSVCGLELLPEDSTSEGDNIFKNLTAYTSGNEYKTLLYEYDGLYTLPEITAVGPAGEELTPVVDSNGVYRFFYTSDKNIPDDAEKSARNFFDAYMNYSSSALSLGAMGKLLETVQPDTELSRYILYSSDAMYWASDTEVSYNELVIDNFHSINDSCFTCTIRYSADFTATSWYEQYSYDMQNGYKMVFVKNGKMWRAAAMYAF